MKYKIQIVFLLLVSSNILASTSTHEKAKHKLHGSVLYNSMSYPIGSYITCNWSKISESKAILKRCYSNNILNFYTRGAASKLFWPGEYSLKLKGKITYDINTCLIYMDEEIIGEYYVGKCTNGFTKNGFRITDASFYIDTVNKEIIID